MESEDAFSKRNNRGRNAEELEQELGSDSDSDDMIPIHESAQMMEEEMPNMDFEFYDPNPHQLRSVRNLLNPYGKEIKDLDTNELAGAITSQIVGVMLGCPDDEAESKELQAKGLYDKEIFGFVTILNIGFYSSSKFMPCILKKWKELVAASGSPHAEKFQKLVEPTNLSKICLLMAERLLNVPSQLIPTLYEQFTEDLVWVAQNDKEESPKFQVDWVLYMVRGQKQFVAKAKAGNKKVQGGSMGKSYEFVCSKFEDELFYKGAEYVVELGASSAKSAAGGTLIEEPESSVPIVRMICVLRADKVLGLMKELKGFLNN